MSTSAIAVAVVAVILVSCASARPSDEWTPRARTAASAGRAFGAAARRSYSVAAKQPEKQEDDAPEARSTQNEVGEDEGWLSWLPAAEMRVLGKVWEDCSERGDMTGCLKGKALTFLDRAARKESLAMPGGLMLVRTAKQDAANAPVTDADLEASLPRDLSQRDSKLDQMLFERVLSFVQTHALRFNLGEDAGDERGIKKKDLLPYLLLGKLVASSMIAMAFTGLALLAGKALMVSKVALLLSGIVALKKLFSHGSSGSGVEVVNVPSGHGHYGRSLDQQEQQDAASSMAYRGQIQRPATAQA